MEKQQREQVDRNIREAKEKLEAEMEAARHEHQLMLMRQGKNQILSVKIICSHYFMCSILIVYLCMVVKVSESLLDDWPFNKMHNRERGSTSTEVMLFSDKYLKIKCNSDFCRLKGDTRAIVLF